MTQHYRSSKESPDRKLYAAIDKIGGWKEVKVEVLKTLVYTERLLREDEDLLIRLEDPKCLNTLRAVSADEETVKKRIVLSNIQRTKKYAIDRTNPEWVAQERQRANDLYARQKSDPEWMEKKRVVSLASYYRKMERKKELQ